MSINEKTHPPLIHRWVQLRPRPEYVARVDIPRRVGEDGVPEPREEAHGQVLLRGSRGLDVQLRQRPALKVFDLPPHRHLLPVRECPLQIFIIRQFTDQ